MPPFSLSTIVEALGAHTPRVVAQGDEGVFYAAVAVLLHEPRGGEPEVLLIRRARRDGDAWSGDMAFPGGRRDDADESIEATARRETHEEIGVLLPDPIARLHDFDARVRRRPHPIVVSPFVYVLDEMPRVQTNEEVDEVVWIPLSALSRPGAATRRSFRRGSRHVTAPALCYGDHVIWGMTHDMLETLFEVFGGRLAG